MGIRVDGSGPWPNEVAENMMNASISYSTTENGKRVRIRFIPMTRISEDLQTVVSDKLNGFSKLYQAFLKKQAKVQQDFAKNFTLVILDSSQMYDR